jgi:hypothetical protein
MEEQIWSKLNHVLAERPLSVSTVTISMSGAERSFAQLFRFPDGTVKRVTLTTTMTVADICRLPEVPFLVPLEESGSDSCGHSLRY